MFCLVLMLEFSKSQNDLSVEAGQLTVDHGQLQNSRHKSRSDSALNKTNVGLCSIVYKHLYWSTFPVIPIQCHVGRDQFTSNEEERVSSFIAVDVWTIWAIHLSKLFLINPLRFSSQPGLTWKMGRWQLVTIACCVWNIQWFSTIFFFFWKNNVLVKKCAAHW